MIRKNILKFSILFVVFIMMFLTFTNDIKAGQVPAGDFMTVQYYDTTATTWYQVNDAWYQDDSDDTMKFDYMGEYLATGGLLHVDGILRTEWRIFTNQESIYDSYNRLSLYYGDSIYAISLVGVDNVEVEVLSYGQQPDTWELGIYIEYDDSSSSAYQITLPDVQFVIMKDDGAYSEGYNQGYDDGYVMGESDTTDSIPDVIDENNDGYDDASYDAGRESIESDIDATTTITGFAGGILGAGLSFVLYLMTEFEILGVSLMHVFLGMMVLALSVFVIKLVM